MGAGGLGPRGVTRTPAPQRGPPALAGKESRVLSLCRVTALMSPTFILPVPGGLSAPHGEPRPHLGHRPAQLSSFPSVSSFQLFPGKRFLPFISQRKVPGPCLAPALNPESPTALLPSPSPPAGSGHAGGTTTTALAPKTIGAARHSGQGSGMVDRRTARGVGNVPGWGESLQAASSPKIRVRVKVQEHKGPNVFPCTYWGAAFPPQKCATGARRGWGGPGAGCCRGV